MLCFFQDVSDPEYAQLQDALKSKASIPQKARPIIHAIAVIEEPKPTLSETKGKMATRSPSRGSLRLAHSAEDVSTLERFSRRGEKERCQKKKWGRAGNWHIAIFSSVVIISWYVLEKQSAHATGVQRALSLS